ncbi:MAG: ABC transporter substrate-binding protein [Candidatus Thorarchaeota archaeon]
MNTNRRNRLLAITFITAFLFMAVSPAISPAAAPPGLNIGPNVDKVVFRVIVGDDQMILALQGGVVDLHTGFFDPDNYAILDADPNLDVIDDVLRNGYGHIKINTAKAPFNWTAFRRAFAFAFDKTRVQDDIFLGLSEMQDSLVAYTNTFFSIEDTLPYHYYNPEVAIGNQLLDDAGFAFDPVSGFRNDPNGNPVPQIEVAYSPSSPAIAGGTAQVGVDALRALGFDAVTNQEDFNTYISNLDQHGDYDMIFFATNFYGTGLAWMAYEFGSEYADVPYQNPTNFRNATVDLAIEDLLAATDFPTAYAAGAELQLLLHYEVPTLITYENYYLQAARNDEFTGRVADNGRYGAGKWSLQTMHKLDGSYGGTINVALGQEPDSFNIFTTNSAYSAAVLDMSWSGLFDLGPDLGPYPVLCESWTEELHSDNSDVPEGHHRFTFDIIQNATWSDGTPLTAEDVAYTYYYDYESGQLGNPAGVNLGNMVAAYAPSTYQVVVEFGVQSYWNFGNVAYKTIIPKHIFEDIGIENWNSWNPNFNAEDPNVNNGPFTFTDFEAGEFYEVTVNPYWAYIPDDRFDVVETTTTTTDGGPGGFDMTLAIVAGAVGAAVVILVGGFVLLRQK